MTKDLERHLDWLFGLDEARETRGEVRRMSKYGKSGRPATLRDSVVAVLESAEGRNRTVDQVAKTLSHHKGSVQATLSDCHRMPSVPVTRVGRATYRYMKASQSTGEDLVAKAERISAKSAAACDLERGDLLEIIYLGDDGVILALDGNNNLLNLTMKVLARLGTPST